MCVNMDVGSVRNQSITDKTAMIKIKSSCKSALAKWNQATIKKTKLSTKTDRKPSQTHYADIHTWNTYTECYAMSLNAV